MCTKTDIKNLLKRDYIPRGRAVTDEEFRKMKFRKTEEDEVYQCARQSSYDIQSGPIYCGELAEWIGKTESGVVCLCERHRPPKNQREE